jgi:hypothetical protein
MSGRDRRSRPVEAVKRRLRAAELLAQAAPRPRWPRRWGSGARACGAGRPGWPRGGGGVAAPPGRWPTAQAVGCPGPLRSPRRCGKAPRPTGSPPTCGAWPGWPGWSTASPGCAWPGRRPGGCWSGGWAGACSGPSARPARVLRRRSGVGWPILAQDQTGACATSAWLVVFDNRPGVPGRGGRIPRLALPFDQGVRPSLPLPSVPCARLSTPACRMLGPIVSGHRRCVQVQLVQRARFPVAEQP